MSNLPGRARTQASVIGEGVTERAGMQAAIPADELSLSYTGVPPGNGNSLHDHQTVEVFIPLNSRWRVVWGEQGENSVELEPYDCSVAGTLERSRGQKKCSTRRASTALRSTRGARSFRAVPGTE